MAPSPTDEALIVAPMKAELAPFARRLREPVTERAGQWSVRRGLVGGRRVATAIVGDGGVRARECLEELLDGLRPRRALLVGVAGALSPDLPVGSVVRVDEVLDLTRPGSPHIPERSADVRATAVSVSRVVGTAKEKTALWKRLNRRPSCLVDLESAAFVDTVRSVGAGWDVVRAVSDGSEEDLPREIAAASTGDGHVERWRVAAALTRRPWRFSALMAMRRRVLACADLLADEAVAWVMEGSNGG